jgi:hypothetical protein
MIVLFVLLGVVLYLGFHAVKAYRGDYKPQSICTSCRSIVTPDGRAQGSGGVEILLWLLFIIPGLIYTLWRGSKKIITCPICHAPNPIPLATPAGKALVGSTLAQ